MAFKSRLTERSIQHKFLANHATSQDLHEASSRYVGAGQFAQPTEPFRNATDANAAVLRSGVYEKLLHLFKAEPAVLNVVVQEGDVLPAGTLVDVRAKAKEDRTPDAMRNAAGELASFLAGELPGENVRCRIELFSPDLATSATSLSSASSGD